MSPIPVYLCLPPGPLRCECADAFGAAAEALEDPTDLAALAQREPGLWVWDAERLDPSVLFALGTLTSGPGWMLAAAEPGPPVTLRTLSLGVEHSLEQARAHVENSAADPGVLLDMGRALREMTRARHDINNPLTSALAETQMMLFDGPEGELRQGLEVIQTQLRRIRDLVVSLRHLRAPE